MVSVDRLLHEVNMVLEPDVPADAVRAVRPAGPEHPVAAVIDPNGGVGR